MPIMEIAVVGLMVVLVVVLFGQISKNSKLVAENKKVTPAQVLLRFWVQENVAVIPKSTNKFRIASNRKVWNIRIR